MIELLATAPLSAYLAQQLRAHFVVHELAGADDAGPLPAAADRIRAVTGAGDTKVGGALIGMLPALEIISIFGVGYDGIDLAAAKQRDVVVTHTPDILNDDVADLALALMLAVSRQIVQADRHARCGQWLQGPMALGRKMSGARLGLVGMGRIGQRIALRAQAFGMHVAYTARNRRADVPTCLMPTTPTRHRWPRRATSSSSSRPVAGQRKK